MRRKSITRLGTIILTGSFLIGCAGLAGRVTDRAGDKIGEEIARRVLTPFRHSMIHTAFGIAFWGYGAPLTDSNHPYREGEWTEWVVTTTGDMGKEEATDITWIKKGFAAQTASKDEWWVLKVRGKDSEEIYHYEALFMPKFEALLRLIAQFPGEHPEEISLTAEDFSSPQEGNAGKEKKGGKGEPPPVKVTASTGTSSIKVPAGKFKAQKFQYSGSTAEGDKWQVTFYLSEKVPGGLVSYTVKGISRIQDEEGKVREVKGEHQLRLKAYGTGLQLELLPHVK